MPAKYQCPKCERRFVEWGARKLNFKCPSCRGEELVRLGGVEGQILQPPRLKRRAQKIGKAALDTELTLADVEVPDEEEVIEEGGVEELEFGVDHVPVEEEAEGVERAIPLEEEGAPEIEVVEGAEAPAAELGEELVFDDEAALDLGEVSEEFEEEA